MRLFSFDDAVLRLVSSGCQLGPSLPLASMGGVHRLPCLALVSPLLYRGEPAILIDTESDRETYIGFVGIVSFDKLGGVCRKLVK